MDYVILINFMKITNENQIIMKKIIFSMLLASIIQNPIFAQDTIIVIDSSATIELRELRDSLLSANSPIGVDSSKINISKKELKDWIKEAISEDKHNKLIGTIKLDAAVCENNGLVPYYDKLEKKIVKNNSIESDKFTKLEKVYLDIQDGVIEKIEVYCYDTINGKRIHRKFVNSDFAISLISFDRYRDMRLIDSRDFSTQQQVAIKLGEVIDYQSKHPYICDNEEVELTCQKESDSLELNSNLNNLIDIVLYTDLLSLIDKNSSGLIETELTYKMILLTKSFRNRITAFNYLCSKIGFSKFSDKYAYTNINLNDSTIDRYKLINNSWFNYGAELNLFKFRIFKDLPIQFHFNIGVNGFQSKIVALNGDSIECQTISAIFIPKLVINFKGSIGLEIETPYHYNNIQGYKDVKNWDHMWFIEPKATFFVSTSDKREDRFFFRYEGLMEIFNTGKPYNNDNIINKFQLGYIINIGSIK